MVAGVVVVVSDFAELVRALGPHVMLMRLAGSAGSYNSIFPNSLIVRFEASLNLSDVPFFPKSSLIDLV